MFISLDGIDGVGKSTQVKRLTEHLNALGHEVLALRDPGSTDVGQRLRELLLDSDLEMHRRTEAMLFMASRCEMIQTIILPALSAGKVVISDRFLLSTVVYQSTSADGKTIVDPQFLWQLGNLSNDGLRPDLTILLDMPAADAVQRMDGPADRMESRGVEYMEVVRQAFLKQLLHASDSAVVVDASQDADSIAKQICTAVEDARR